MRKMSIFKEDKAISEMPIQYMVAITVAALSIFIMIVAFRNLWESHQVEEAVKEVNRIVREAELMYNTADDGSKTILNVNFPSGMEKAVFGSRNPGNSNHYYIIMKWGENRSFYSKHVNFTGDYDGMAVLYGRANKIIMELINREGGKYVSIRAS